MALWDTLKKVGGYAAGGIETGVGVATGNPALISGGASQLAAAKQVGARPLVPGVGTTTGPGPVGPQRVGNVPSIPTIAHSHAENRMQNMGRMRRIYGQGAPGSDRTV